MNLDNMNSFIGIDFSDCQTRSDKIEKVITTDVQIFENLFYWLTEDEKEKYFYNLKGSILKNYLSTKPDKFVFNYIMDKYQDIENYIIEELTKLIVDEKLRYQIAEILIKNKDSCYISSIVKTITNDLLKIKLIYLMITQKVNEYTYINTILSLNDDKNKEIFIPILSKYDQVKIIKSFKDKNLMKEYALKKEYSNYRSDLIVATKDQEFIKKQFLRINIPVFRNNLINLISDESFKLELINLLDDKNVRNFLLSNFDKYYDSFLVNFDELKTVEDKIDEEITIGVELECCNKNIKNYKNVQNVLGNFRIKKDSSVHSGFEIVSPILHYTQSDMKKLKSVCNLLEKSGFYTDYSCGGHIHIGANYLSTTNEMYMLLYLYNNCEHIIYQICNKEHSKTRKSINRYAKTTKDIYLKASEEGILNENITPDEMIDILKEINGSRYKGLNLKNLDNYYKKTIEFRMPNGEIQFDELIANIKLFSKLIQSAKELSNANITDKRKSQALRLSNYMPEKERLEIFLSILFNSEKEKEIYRKRYNSNIAFTEMIKKELFYRNEKLIEIDEESKKLSKKVTNF